MSRPASARALLDLVHDLVERHLAEAEVPFQVEAEGEERRGHPARDGDLDVGQVGLLERVPGDDDRAVARAHARPVRKDHVTVLHERVRVQRDRRHLEPALERPLVQGLDALEHVLELEAAPVHAAGCETPEHERIVGVRAMSKANAQRWRG